MTVSSPFENHLDWTSLKLRLPKVGYGPFRILEAAPWLLLATVVRLYGHTKAMVLPSYLIAMYCVIIAFLLALRRTIELNDGQTPLGNLTFQDQNLFVGQVARWWFPLTIGMVALFSPLFGYLQAFAAIVPGVDGVAFDLISNYGMLWSPAIAIMLFFAALAAANNQRPTFKTVISGIRYHQRWMVVAYVLLVILLLVMSPIQEQYRSIVRGTLILPLPDKIKSCLIVGFVFSFAFARLWLSLLILSSVFKRSCDELANQRSRIP